MDLVTLIKHTEKAIYNATENNSKLTDNILEMEGMSGHKTRHLYNNICNLPGAKYLEVGTWKGSSLISSLYNNNLEYSYCVDNWSEFNDNKWGNPENEFRENIKLYLEPDVLSKLKIINKNSWDITIEDLCGSSIDIFYMMANIIMRLKNVQLRIMSLSFQNML